MTLLTHLATGTTTTCRAWAVTRGDGVTLGFTDHDRDLTFDGITFRADTGLSAQAIEQSTGLSVDNTEAIGTLTDTAITEADIIAGRYDGAEVRFWIVNWADTSERALRFRGSIGEMRRNGPEFRAELRGLAEALNQPQGRVFQRGCSASLGDAACRVDLNTPAFRHETSVYAVKRNRVFWTDPLPQAERWFEKGCLTVLSGAATGLSGLIKANRIDGPRHLIELWQPLGADVAAGDLIRLEAGCDKRMTTCQAKFDNLLNFRGFPDIPGEDWLVSTPRRAGSNDGGSLR